VKNLKLYIIAGEASGDLHASNLMKELKKQNSSIAFRFWGGDLMAKSGGTPVKHIKELAFMGFIEVILNLKTILSNIKQCKKDIVEYKPDAIILVDYPGFNLRIAEWAKKSGIKVIYYISPQIWAWKQNRVYKIKKCVDKMYVVLPFEKDFYKKFDYQVDFVGHPLLDAIETYKENEFQEKIFREKHTLGKKPILAVLPGSRKQEIKIKLPIMLQAVSDFKNYEIVIAQSPNMVSTFYEQFIADKEIHLIQGETYEILNSAELALVTSGTATLETALFDVPQVVCYKGSRLSYMIAKQLIKVKFISLVNLIMNKEVVKELIQGECNSVAIRREILLLEKGGDKRKKMLEEYSILKNKLGGRGASSITAKSILEFLK
jgi:lipid-A-disaccharide synthase